VIWVEDNIKFGQNNILVSWDSIVSIATGYGLDYRGVGVQVPVGSKIFSSPHCVDQLWGPPNLLSNGYLGLFPQGVKWQGHEVDHSLQIVPRSGKCGSIHSLSHTPSWHSGWLVKHWITLTFTLPQHSWNSGDVIPFNWRSQWTENIRGTPYEWRFYTNKSFYPSSVKGLNCSWYQKLTNTMSTAQIQTHLTVMQGLKIS
jgi:hypothetical protein